MSKTLNRYVYAFDNPAAEQDPSWRWRWDSVGKALEPDYAHVTSARPVT